MADEQLSIILVTTPSQDVAQQLAHDLVRERLAACVNVVSGVRSIYAWEGKIERAEEVLMIMNITPCGRTTALARRTPWSRRGILDTQSWASRLYIPRGMWPRRRLHPSSLH